MIPDSIFTLELIQSYFPRPYTLYKKPPQIFSDVRHAILGILSTPMCRLAGHYGRKAGLNWKL